MWSFLFTDNGTQFVSKVFGMLCTHRGTNYMTTTACHSHTKGQVDRYNNTNVTRLRHNALTHQRDRDLIVQSLICSGNRHIHLCTKTTPSCFVLRRYLPISNTFGNPSALVAESVSEHTHTNYQRNCLHA